MAAPQDLTGNAPPSLSVRVTMDATAGNLRNVQLPPWARSVLIAFKQSDDSTDAGGWLQLPAGTDAAARSTDAQPIPSGGSLTHFVSGETSRARVLGGKIISLACDSNSGYAHLICER